ncbi:MAG: hypothetical protein ACR2FY_10065 [Pirellulaceae bacterium]
MFRFAQSLVSRRSVRRPSACQKSRRRSYRPLNGFEALEKREVLAAAGLGAVSSLVSFDISIHGTGVRYSELGLPAEITGDLFAAGGKSAHLTRIGNYCETLTPILMDVNGDQVLDFVGTMGVATFNFFAGSSTVGLIGSITTVDTSYIQGVTAAGQIIVGSQGTITNGTLALSHVSGGFVSQSIVGFDPTFQMETNVHFTVTAPSMSVAVAMAGSNQNVAATTSDSAAHKPADHDKTKQESHHVSQAVPAVIDNAPGKGRGQSDLTRHERSVDQTFQVDTDWRAGEDAVPV